MCYCVLNFIALNVNNLHNCKEIKCGYIQIIHFDGCTQSIGITTYVCYTVQEYNFRKNITTYDSRLSSYW